MECSVCIATYNKPDLLRHTLQSIAYQDVPFEWELIVVDDGSPNTLTEKVCNEFQKVCYIRLEKSTGYGNPAKARNVAYRWASGKTLICQSDDVIHHSPNCIENLVTQLQPNTFLLAEVINTDTYGNVTCNRDTADYGGYLQTYVSPKNRRPLFFLGSIARKDLYAVGGNDEEFVFPSGEDRWFALCLIRGLGLTPVYTSSIVGHHQQHKHCNPNQIGHSQALIKQKIQRATRNPKLWQASGGPWQYTK